MDISKYQYQSEFAKRYVAQGVQEGLRRGLQQGVTQGEASGRVAIVSHQLSRLFGPLTPDVQDHLRHASVEDLDAIGERILFAGTLQEALEG